MFESVSQLRDNLVGAITGREDKKTKKDDGNSRHSAKVDSAFGVIYPAYLTVDTRESIMVDLPASASAFFPTSLTHSGSTGNSSDGFSCSSSSGTDNTKIDHRLPIDRIGQYAVYRSMAQDPTIDCAIKMHLANALSATIDTGEILSIRSIDDKESAIVEDLCATLMPIINKNLNEWGRKAAVYGSCFGRVYGDNGVGITSVRSDYYTKAEFVKKYEKGGRLAGFTTSFQGANAMSKGITLMPPWSFVCFEIPEWNDSSECVEPVNLGGIVDLSINSEDLEGLSESQEYGTSIIATAFGPWMDLLDAICSMKMSRRNAARLERIIGVNTGKLDPQRAASYLDMIAERIVNASEEIDKQSWLSGNVKIVHNHIVPVWGDKGGLQIDTAQTSADINSIEDVLFHVKRLGSAVGIDASLLGFGDMLSGFLGDGGTQQLSIIAADKANLVRHAIKNGIHRLCEIHVAYKYGKVFLPNECPWKIEFNSLSTAIEREATQNFETKTNAMGAFIANIATVDPEFTVCDRRGLFHMLCQMLKISDEDFDKVFPPNKKEEAGEGVAEGEEI